MPHYMAIPFKLHYFDSCKKVFVCANCMLYSVAYLLICDVFCIRYVEESLVASHSALKVGVEYLGFACIHADQYHERAHHTDL